MLRFLVPFFLLLSFNAQAKWADFSLADVRIDKLNFEETVKKDGSYDIIVEKEFEILKESGRELAAHYTLSYNRDSEDLKILDAKTIYQGKEYPVEQKFIEDKPLASSQYGFDQVNQVLIAFPKVEIGSKIILKFIKNVRKTPINGHFDEFYDFGVNEWLKNSIIKIHSEIPLHIFVNDPDNHLKITKDKDNNFYNLEVKLVKEIYKDFINEPKNSLFNKKARTYISVSSSENWLQLASDLSRQNFAKIYSQELPKEFLEIVDLAKNTNEETEQINLVTSSLNDKIQYLADNTTIEGRLAPRDLKIIVESQLGDCKDLSAATLAILTKLGYKAQFALVLRGEGSFYPETLPSLFVFNHAIVKVTGKKGNVYWVDPTNLQSMADGIFPDIAGKPVLVLDELATSYEKIPNIDPNHALAVLNREIIILDDSKNLQKGKMLFKNEESLHLNGSELVTSRENIISNLLSKLSGSILDENSNNFLNVPDLRSRIVKDVEIEYSFEQNNFLFRTNLGKMVPLDFQQISISNITDVAKDSVADIYIGPPFRYKRNTLIKEVKASNIDSLNKIVDSKWVYIARKLSLQKNDILVEDDVVIKQSIIFNHELKSEEYLKLKSDLERHFQNIVLVFN